MNRRFPMDLYFGNPGHHAIPADIQQGKLFLGLELLSGDVIIPIIRTLWQPAYHPDRGFFEVF